MKYLLIFLLLTACSATKKEPIQVPDIWQYGAQYRAMTEATDSLKNWWQNFDDPVINRLVEQSLNDSPDRNIAKARILEARGIRRGTRAILFPQIQGTGQVGREDNIQLGVGNFSQAGFDASFELDIFGVNRLNDKAAQLQIKALENDYNAVTLTLIGDVIRTYIDHRAAERQIEIARQNLELQTKTLELIRTLEKFGEVARLDVDRAMTVVENTRATIPAFERQQVTAALQLSVLLGLTPEKLIEILETCSKYCFSYKIINADNILAEPAKVISQRPDVKAATAILAANNASTRAATAALFPQFSLGGFYGVADDALTSTTNIWSIALNGAVNLIDFGRLEAQIDAAKAREQQAYEQYRKTILTAVADVETALNDYSKLQQQTAALSTAATSAKNAFKQAEILYNEGEIAFLDVLDAQRQLNDVESNVIAVNADKIQSLVRLYKSLGVY